jgi:hypothetical protein
MALMAKSLPNRYTEKVLELLISFMTFHYKRIEVDPSFDEVSFMTLVVEVTKMKVNNLHFSAV